MAKPRKPVTGVRRSGWLLGRGLLGLALVLGAAFAFAPREPLGLVPRFDAAALPADLDVWLRQSEAAFADIVPGTEKRILWAGKPGDKTPVSIVYLHGFSASSEEIRPVPQQIARALGANLYFARLSGHGRSGDAMAEPTVQDWIDDTAEAIAIGQRIGGKVFVIGTSTGGTLAAEAVNAPALADRIAGVVFISPNFGLNHWAAGMLTWPLARQWAPMLAGAEQGFAPLNPDHARYWTERYPTAALLPMAALAAHAAAADYTGVGTPALFLYSPADRVVSPSAIEEVAGQWGGPMVIVAREMGPGDDPWNHVIAGDIVSPGQTAETVQIIADWIRRF